MASDNIHKNKSYIKTNKCNPECISKFDNL